MFTQRRILITYLCACMAFPLFAGFIPLSTVSEKAYSSGKSPESYLSQKASSNRLILLGTRHDNEQINDLIFDSLPVLVRESGIRTLFVEIPSNQQHLIDSFKRGDCQAVDIPVHRIIASASFLKVIIRAKELGLDIIAIDNGEDAEISRDQWMALRVSGYLRSHPQAKGLAIVGNRHIFKNIKWTYGEYPSLADYLEPMKPYSVVTWPGGTAGGHPVALDVDSSIFLGVKDPTLMCMNILPQTSLATAADGVILLSE